jgi:Lrp/AsnC family transcriptional regulator for asnA, asnC and gidA
MPPQPPNRRDAELPTPLDLVIDETDRNIIAALHEDPRTTNKAIAQAVAVSEATVANRIRRLVAAGALRFTLQRNSAQQGFRFQAIAYLTVTGRAAAAAAADLAKIDNVFTVILVEGADDIIAFINCRGHQDAYNIVRAAIAKVHGVQRITMDLTLSIIKNENKFAMIGPQPI